MREKFNKIINKIIIKKYFCLIFIQILFNFSAARPIKLEPREGLQQPHFILVLNDAGLFVAGYLTITSSVKIHERLSCELARMRR